MAHRFDATLKDIVARHPADFAIVTGIDANAPTKALNVDLSTISAATDVALGVGEPLREIVDLNFQTGPDAHLGSRLHVYNAILHDRHAVPVRSIAILLRPKADAESITGKLAYGAVESRVEFTYRVVRLWFEPVESYLQAGVAALPLATLCRMPPEKSLVDALHDVVGEIDRRLGREAVREEAVRLMTAAYILTGLRVKKDELAAIYRGMQIMKESTAYDAILEEGRLEGLVAGQFKGELLRSHRLLLNQGREKFGDPDAATEAELTAITDLDRLDRIAVAMLSAPSWDALLATP